ncbi:2-keto-3-deoxygluconate permease [Pontibacillus marinus]|uniref:2-keto-3-deoxygluconate permease n=1 Tax=Pontibacillus marinus BH030004 = DSM 16465 TaxID=1385511 RepID=A0A0A5GEV4_9BACI|nr:2-keto-3-deoxygluconate permease [Pontibacillus marinus]KGX91756.1 2-keto-3-deoxygluconate permease [Pontibacillus marinus BH030004 = DSM 16465]
MKIKKTIEKVPGGLMVVPLMFGALLNTIDQAHLPFIEAILKALGQSAGEDGHYSFLYIGGFSEALFKTGALTLIALFLFCAGSQMDLRVGGKALKKGAIITTAKYLTGLSVGLLFSVFFDPMSGLLGLSTMAIVAAMTNSNGGMYAALTGEYGNRSDVGAVAILSLNDGPFFTMLALGMMGTSFPFIAFLSVLLPIGLGMLLGNLDEDIKSFLAPGETLTIPFFAFALGAGMNFMNFFNPEVVGAGLVLGLMTTILTGFAGIAALKLFREKSQIGGVAEASTAGNAAATPAAIAAAAGVAASTGSMTAAKAQQFQDIASLATAQVSISTLTTAVLCPIFVILWDKHQKKKGIDGSLPDEQLTKSHQSYQVNQEANA